MIKKFITWLGIAFLVFFIAFKPSAAAEVVRMLGNTAVTALQSLGDFLSSLVN